MSHQNKPVAGKKASRQKADPIDLVNLRAPAKSFSRTAASRIA